MFRHTLDMSNTAHTLQGENYMYNNYSFYFTTKEKIYAISKDDYWTLSKDLIGEGRPLFHVSRADKVLLWRDDINNGHLLAAIRLYKAAINMGLSPAEIVRANVDRDLLSNAA